MMEQLFKERKEKLHLFKSLRKKRETERKEVPEDFIQNVQSVKN